MAKHQRVRSARVAGLCCLLLAAVSPAAAQTVGTTGAVNPASTGTPPGGSERTLRIGSDVVFQERIRTTASGSLQVLFVDTTTLTIGPNSDLTIDEFVYNPNAGSGRFVASLARGTMRFVGGQISHRQGATINTPTATVGIRGGGAFLSADADNTQVACTAGDCTIMTPDAPPIELDPGETAQVSEAGVSEGTASTQSLSGFIGRITAPASSSPADAGVAEASGPPVESFSEPAFSDPNLGFDQQVQQEIATESSDPPDEQEPPEEEPPPPEPPPPPPPPPPED